MLWVVVIVIVGILIIVAVSNSNNPAKQTENIKQWFDKYPEQNYYKVQKYLQNLFSEPYDKNKAFILNETEFIVRRNQDRVQYKENELWRQHTITILSSDSFSVEAKNAVVSAWSEYISAQNTLYDAIEIGYANTDEMYEMGDHIRASKSALTGVMAAYNFDLERESKTFVDEINHKFPSKKKKTKVASRLV